jgi:penicillin-binding protein 1A
VGSVKGPNRYNPFIKKTPAEKEKAKRLAKERKDYVLDKMLEQNYISRHEWTRAKEQPVPFKEGRITFQLNVILDYVRNQLESPFFKEILREQGVENIATSGISIYTSVDKGIQDAAL